MVALASTALFALSVGIPATFFPHGFYEHFPFVGHWVDRLPAYNAHLATDTGELQLAFGLLFGWAAFRPTRALVMPLSLAYAASQALHLVFHLAHLDDFPLTDGIAQTLALLALVVVPLIPAWVYRRTGRQVEA